MSMSDITTLCYLESSGSYLMMHRNKKEGDINKGKWIGLGGHLREGETVRQCIRREVEEESGLTLLSLNFRGIVRFISDDYEEYVFLYYSDNYEGELNSDCSEGELKWVNKTEIEFLELWEGDRLFLPLLDSNNHFFYLTLNYDKEGNLVSSHGCPEIYQERDAVQNYSKKLTSLGSRALIVTGRHSAKNNGALSDVVNALEYRGISYALFDEVEENPSVDTILMGRNAGISADADFIIGIGGGSPMDAAKAIALLLKNPGKGVDFLYESGNPSDALPVVCIPTTCGSGSEATAVSVLTRPDISKKGSIPYRIFPDYSFLDIKYLRKADPQLIRNTAMDAFSHLIESLINSGANDLCRAIALQGLHKFRYVKEALLRKEVPGDSTLDDLMAMACLAGMAIAITGTALPHAMSYTLTLDRHIPHGPSAAYFIPGYLHAAGKLADPVWDQIKIHDAWDLKEYFMRLYHFEKIDKETVAAAVESVSGNEAKLATAPFNVDPALLNEIAVFMDPHHHE